uniref:Uncharacterized protein n=1 Tax=Minutocellus polymorphus TaxID=265543 RepID=A0A7S0AWN3_9STRA|mmetsp:Transcript_5710/g.9653  ORF Transcript_5710/g.9653 Transcript_5710/m.9653 type:complete len:306 (+) Transcript_5710:153-1070(+)
MVIRGILKPCERTGLLDGMGEEYSLDIGVRKKKSCCTASHMCYFLMAAAVGVFLYLVFTSDSLDNMSAQKQIDMLNDATISGNVKSGCQSTLVIMRHCEFTTAEDAEVLDEEGNQHCSATGLARADYVPSLFGHGARWPLPSKLYAMKRDREGVREEDNYLNYREIETLTPLADKAEVDINSSFSDGGERQLALEYFDDLGSGEYCDKSVVVSWKVQRIVTLAQALGCGEQQGCPERHKKRDFDKVWQLTYMYWEVEDDDEEEEDGGEDTDAQRALRRKKKKRTITFDEGWNVHGKVIKEHFQAQ